MPLVSVDPFVVINPSKSAPGQVHRTTVIRSQDGPKAVDCDCPGFMGHKRCWHLENAEEEATVWLQEHGQSLALTVPAPAAPAPFNPAPISIGPYRPPVSLIPSKSEVDGMIHLSNALAKAAGFAVPREMDDPRKVFAVICLGNELGVRPMVAINNMIIIKGKVSPNGQLMMGLVRARDATADFRFVYGPSPDGCTVELWRGGRRVSTGRFMAADAQRSGLLKEERWRLYPQDMYLWRAVARAVRIGASDLSLALEGVGLPSGEPLADASDPFEADTAADMDSPAELPAGGHTVATSPGAPADGGYIWEPMYLAGLSEYHISPVDVRRFLNAAPGADYEAIDDWLFAVEVHDLAARVRGLFEAVGDFVRPAAADGPPPDGGRMI